MTSINALPNIHLKSNPEWALQIKRKICLLMCTQPNHSVAFCNFKKCISTELYLSKKLTMLLPGKQLVSASLMRFFPVTNFMHSSIQCSFCVRISPTWRQFICQFLVVECILKLFYLWRKINHIQFQEFDQTKWRQQNFARCFQFLSIFKKIPRSFCNLNFDNLLLGS